MLNDPVLPLPVLPNRTLFRDTSPEFLASRATELSDFLDALLIQYNGFTDEEDRRAVDRFLGREAIP